MGIRAIGPFLRRVGSEGALIEINASKIKLCFKWVTGRSSFYN